MVGGRARPAAAVWGMRSGARPPVLEAARGKGSVLGPQLYGPNEC